MIVGSKSVDKYSFDRYCSILFHQYLFLHLIINTMLSSFMIFVNLMAGKHYVGVVSFAVILSGVSLISYLRHLDFPFCVCLHFLPSYLWIRKSSLCIREVSSLLDELEIFFSQFVDFDFAQSVFCYAKTEDICGVNLSILYFSLILDFVLQFFSL